jgi:FAD/FMN-containing dehydrogenase
MPDQISAKSDQYLIEKLEAAAGPGGLIRGAAAEPYYTDVLRALATPLAVLRPDSVTALQEIVAIAAAAGLAMFPRGGGASYTDAFLPDTQRAIIVDTGRLNRILEINEIDATVTVESGVTWAALKHALDPLGLRTPFFGPFSGLAATIGGSMSQNSISHGSGAHGISAQSVLSMDVVLASGELLRTTAGQNGMMPFNRHYGPDLTGLFTGDCGALGIKTRITLPLLNRKPAFAALSIAYADFAGLAEGMRLLARERLDDEHFAIDSALSRGQIARQDARAVRAAAAAVFKSARNPFAALAQLARMALAGTRDLAESAYVLHIILEGVSKPEVAAKTARLREVLRQGREIANSIPTVVHGMPFAPLTNTLGPNGERWVPMHGVLPHSRVVAFHAALEALYAGAAADMKKHGVWVGGMFTTVGSSGVLYEVAMYWPGAHTAYHRAAVPAAYLANLKSYPDDPAATEFVLALKQSIIDLIAAFGATHFQVGRAYPYAAALQPPAMALLEAVKQQLDPRGLMNPGVLMAGRNAV